MEPTRLAPGVAYQIAAVAGEEDYTGEPSGLVVAPQSTYVKSACYQ